MYEYKAKIIKIVDGDTVDVDIDLGFGIWMKNERVRIMGIDTPESRTRDKVEKKFGLAAKKRLTELLKEHTVLMTEVDKNGLDMKGKFGRVLGDFKTDSGVKVTQVLIKEGHAVAYFGGAKADVEAQHMKNRTRLINEGVVTL